LRTVCCEWRSRGLSGSERDVVIDVIKAGRSGCARRCLTRTIALGLGGLALLTAEALLAAVTLLIAITLLVVVGIAARTAALAATGVEHLHLGRNDLGGVTLDAILFPGARAQAALDVQLGALLHVFTNNLRQAVEEHHPVPFGTLLGLAGILVLPGFTGGQGNVGYRSAAAQKARFGIAAAISHQDDLVHASACHITLQVFVIRFISSQLVWRKHSTK